jgi:hypothetical protein
MVSGGGGGGTFVRSIDKLMLYSRRVPLWAATEENDL